MPPPLLPTFAHIGVQHLLLSHGLVPAKATAAAAASTAMIDPTGVQERPRQPPKPQPKQARQVQQLLLGLHSMQHYHTRLAAACWAAAGREAGRQADDAPVALARDLAPAMVVLRAEVRLPVLPPAPMLTRQPAQLHRHAAGSWAGAAAPQLRVSPQQHQQQRRPPTVVVVVVVHGNGLAGCTGALLRLPGGGAAQLAASQVTNLARQQLLDQMAGGSTGGGRLVATSSALRKAAARVGSWGRGRHHQQAQTEFHQPGLLLQFAAPVAALAQLQLQQQEEAGRLLVPEGTLMLLSDFARVEAPVRLQPQVVWLLGLEPMLAAATFRQLKSAAAAAGAAGPEQQQPRRLASLSHLAAPLHGLAAAAGSGLAWRRSAAGGARGGSSSGETTGSTLPVAGADGPAGGLQPRQPSLLRRLRQTYAAALAGLRQRWATGGRLLAGSEQGPTLPAVLLRGQLLLDATPLLLAGGGSGADAVEQQVEAAREVVRWAATQQRQGAGAEQEHSDEGWEQGLEEAEDEDLAELQQLGLAARVRRSVAHAGSAARRRALLLRGRRRAVLSSLPAPDMVVLVLDHRQLLSGSYGEGLDAAALAAVRRLAGACRECGGAPLLLALASRRPLSAPFRRQIAHSCGLTDGSDGSGRWGSVVPMADAAPRDSGEDAAAAVRVGLLEAALHAYGARQQLSGGAKWQGSRL